MAKLKGEKPTGPKEFDPKKTKVFMANGNKYFVTDKISIDRWKEYEKLVPKITYGVDFDEMFKQLKKAFALCNERKLADVSVILHNLMSGIADINNDAREHPALMMAALVINKEGEDVGKYDEQVQLEKIKDWAAEGYETLGFFTYALHCIQGFRQTYTDYIQEQVTIKSSLKK